MFKNIHYTFSVLNMYFAADTSQNSEANEHGPFDINKRFEL